MGLLQTMGNGQGYLKAGFLGFPKSGKTYTATLLAIGTRALFSLDGPIAFFDTEGGSEYIADRIKALTGKDLIGVRSRSFSDLLAVGREAEKEGVSVLIADSMTHVWRELCDAHLKTINEGRKKKGLGPRYRLEFQDWGIIKGKWAEWTDFYLNSKLHIVIAGRAGFEYDYEENEETNKRELVKTGVKMKTEGEFGFEPSLLVEMERSQKLGEKTEIVHRATIIGDRFGVIDGAQRDNPTFDFFKPHIAKLTPGAHAPIDTEIKTDLGVDQDGDAQWQREKRERTILCEEIQGELLRHWPGQTKEEKTAKLEAIEKAFGTRSWTKVESKISIMDLRNGLKALKGTLNGDGHVDERYEMERAAAIAAIRQGMDAQKWSEEDRNQYVLENMGLDALNELREEMEVAF